MQIPAQITRYVSGWHSELAWESGPLARTWRLTGPAGEQRYLKSAPADGEVPIRGEAVRLRWAGRNGLPVPGVWRPAPPARPSGCSPMPCPAAMP